MEERIIELEKRVAYLDMQIEELTEVINSQQTALSDLQNQINTFSEKMESGELVKPIDDEEPPPHY
ncbi:MAG: SlyX family protein [Candidatus Omnitrophica bacterium]|nr:SlyX family protein [Candidatus Omnitrophota bacterium]